jgi:CheY-like chemotaxis protein
MGLATALRVLVIDDDDIAREVLCEALSSVGHIVHELPSAIGASRAIAEHDIQAVVLDVMMPSINGDKLARLLRQATTGRSLTIILVSSQPAAELNALAQAAMADAVVSKSDVRSQLARTLQRAHIGRASQRTAAL